MRPAAAPQRAAMHQHRATPGRPRAGRALLLALLLGCAAAASGANASEPALGSGDGGSSSLGEVRTRSKPSRAARLRCAPCSA